MLTEAELIRECKNFRPLAQKELYKRYAGKMRATCLRYAGNPEEAKDIMQEGFIKVFYNIDKFSGTGSLEGWIKRIFINTAIDYYNKRKKNFPVGSIEEGSTYDIAEEEGEGSDRETNVIFDAKLSQTEILESLQILSDAYRVVFNMYYIEEYSHKEIADMLGIDEATSRGRLFRGRKILQKHLYKVCGEKIKTQFLNAE